MFRRFSSSIRRCFVPPLLASIARSSAATSATPGGAAPPPCRRAGDDRHPRNMDRTWSASCDTLQVIRKVLQVIIEILSSLQQNLKQPGCTQNVQICKGLQPSNTWWLCLTHQIWRQQIPEGWLQLTPRSDASIRCKSCSWLEDLQVITKKKNIKIAKQLAKDCCAFANARNGIWFTSNNLHTNGQRTLSFVTKYCNMPRESKGQLLRNLCWLRCTVALHHLTLTEFEGLKESNLAPHAELRQCIIAAKGTLNCTPW